MIIDETVLRRLHELKLELDTQDGQVREYVTALETALRQLNLGVPIWTTIDEHATLHYRKQSKEWRLVIERDDGTHTMLSDAPRNLRALAVSLVPNLLEDAVGQMQAMITRRVEVLETVGAFVGAFKIALPDPLPRRKIVAK